MNARAKPIRIFYSWQSDLPSKFTRTAIVRRLDEFSKSFTQRLHIDEATRDEAGSPNIPQTILEKIGKSDIFIADVTTINAGDKSRKCPNPNVVFELGYAVQIMGWSRIILIFNTAYGSLPDDLPFDFDRHRVSKYSLCEASPKGAENHLGSLLKTALNSIISSNPKRPSELAGLTEQQLRYNRDVKALEWALEEMHLPTIDDHIESLPHMFPYRSLHFFEGLKGVVLGNSLFHLNDKKLSVAFKNFVRAWQETVRHDNEYHLNNGSTFVIFTNPGDAPLPPEREVVWQAIDAARAEMQSSLSYILKRVRKDFPSIDLRETSKHAWEDYRRHQE